MDINGQIEEWFWEYGNDVYNYLVYYTGRTDVEDLVQEVFIKALKGVGGFKGISTPKTWLFSIARNAAVDYIRKQHPVENLSEECLYLLPSDEMSPDDKLLLKEDFKRIYQALNSLKQNYRDVLILRGIKGLSPAETAVILNWRESKVNVTLHRALKALEKEISVSDKEEAL